MVNDIQNYIADKEKIINKIRSFSSIDALIDYENKHLKYNGIYDDFEKIVLAQKKALQLKKRFQDREPIVQHVIYNCLKENNYDKKYIEQVIGNLGYNREEYATKSLIQRAEKFLNDVKDNKLAVNLIISYYEKDANKKRIAERLNKANIKALTPKDKVEPIKLNFDETDIFDRWKKMNTSMNDDFRSLINRMLDEKILPSDKKGREIIKQAGLNGIKVTEYFNLLNQIALKLDFQGKEKEMAKLLQKLNDSEIVLLCDMSRDGIAYNSDEFKEILKNKSVRSAVINEYLYDPNSAKLNQAEMELIEELKNKGIRTRNSELEKLIEQRKIRPDMLGQYFDLSHQIKETVEDSKDPLEMSENEEKLSDDKTIPVGLVPPTERDLAPKNNPEIKVQKGLSLTKLNPEERLEELYFKVHEIDKYDNEFLQMVREGRWDLAQSIRSDMNVYPLLKDNRAEVEKLLAAVQSKKGKAARFFERVKRLFGSKKKQKFDVVANRDEEDILTVVRKR